MADLENAVVLVIYIIFIVGFLIKGAQLLDSIGGMVIYYGIPIAIVGIIWFLSSTYSALSWLWPFGK